MTREGPFSGTERHRRSVIGAIGTAAVGTVTALSGCMGGSGGDSDDPMIDNEPDYKGWFSGVSNHRGTHDRRDQDEVTVEVGVSANAGSFGYGPTAIAISPGTSVTWEWTGKGGKHNVVSESEVFDSGQAVEGQDRSFEHSFESPGVFRYVCTPHRSVGMRGAVFVALGD